VNSNTHPEQGSKLPAPFAQSGLIPGSSSIYIVKKGDTLWGIASRLRLDINHLARLNHLSKAQRHWLSVGQQLKLNGDPIAEPSLVCINLVDSNGFPVVGAELKLSYQGGDYRLQTNMQGVSSTVQIPSPQTGFSVALMNVEFDWELIHMVPALPPGLWRYRLMSGDILVHYVLRPDTGTARDTATILTDDLGRKNQKQLLDVHRSIPVLMSDDTKSPTPHVRSDGRRETRESRGLATSTISPHRIEGGLKLDAGNAAWHDAILAAAKRHQLEPWFIAAVVEIESAKKTKPVSRISRSGSLESVHLPCWDTDAGDGMSDHAVGICQFQYPAWLDVACNPLSHLSQTLCQRFGCQSLRHDVSKSVFPSARNTRRVLFTDAGKEISELDYKPLRKHPVFAIDGAAAYLNHNLNIALKAPAFSQGFKQLNRTEQLMVCYACFNLGRKAAMAMLSNRWADIKRFTDSRPDLLRASDQQKLIEFSRQGALGTEEKTLLTLTWPQRFDLRRFMADPSLHEPGSIFKILNTFSDAATQAAANASIAANRETRKQTKPSLGQSKRTPTAAPGLKTPLSEKLVTIDDHSAFAVRVPASASATAPAASPTAASSAAHRDLKDHKPLPVTITTILKRNPGVGWERGAAHKPRVYSPPLSMPLKMRVRAPGDSPGGVDFKVSKSGVGLERISNKKPRWHTGIDLATSAGTQVMTPFSGWASGLKTDPAGFGHYAIVQYQAEDLPSAPRAYLRHLAIEHFELLFAHLDDKSALIFKSVERSFIPAGTVIGIAGYSGNAGGMDRESTGMHLHLEARVEGKYFDPLPLFPAHEIQDACRIYRFNAWHFPQTYEPFECLLPSCKACGIDPRSLTAYCPPPKGGFHTQIPPQLIHYQRRASTAQGS
jgi:murein DD-endopeptidase MepM/ murein hydrolase activator NlpD